MRILGLFLFAAIWLFLGVITMFLVLLGITVCSSVEGAPPQAPSPLQAPVSQYWVVEPPVGSCGCAPNTSCECGPSCPCYNGKSPAPKPKPKPPVVIRRRIIIRAGVSCQPPPQPVTYPIIAPTFAPAPIMGGYGGMGGGGFGGMGGGFGGGCGSGGCGGGG